MDGRDHSEWMWGDALELLARADRLHRRLFHPRRARSPGPIWEPPVDVIETAAEVIIVAALPGVSEAAVKVALDDGALLVSGERSLPPELAYATIHRLELPQGVFERRIPLPPGRYDEVKRRALDGCLVVNLRKAR